MKDSHNRKLDKETLERLKSFRKARKKSLNKQEKLKKLEKLLKRLWQHLTEKGPTKQNLWYIVTNIDWEPLQVWAWKELLKQKDLGFEEIYEALEKIKNKDLQEKAFEKAQELATFDNLLCMIRFKETYRERAWKELTKRIQENSVNRKHHIKQILFQIIEHVPELSTRALEEFEKLNPSYEELSQIYNYPFISSVPLLPEKLRKLLKRKFRKKDVNVETIFQIHEVIENLKKLKKG